MVRRGEVKDYAEIVNRMGLSGARVTQVCNLALLTPMIQAATRRYSGFSIPERFCPSLVRRAFLVSLAARAEKPAAILHQLYPRQSRVPSRGASLGLPRDGYRRKELGSKCEG